MIAECSQCGEPMLEDAAVCPSCKHENRQRNQGLGAFRLVPWWGWIFVLASGTIFALGQMFGGVTSAWHGGPRVTSWIGLIAAGACGKTSNRLEWSTGKRILVCVAITMAAWAAFFAWNYPFNGLS